MTLIEAVHIMYFTLYNGFGPKGKYIFFINHQKTRVIRGQLPKHLYIFGLVTESFSVPINLE